MSSIAINFRNLAIGLAALGLTLGVAFGAGIAYGRTDDDSQAATADGQTDLAALAATRIAGGNAGNTNAGGFVGGLQALLGDAFGTITAVDGDIVTIETAQGSQEVYVSGATSVELLQPGASSDLQAGAVVVVNGEAGDGSVIEAESISQVPAEFESLLSGGPGQGGGSTTPGGTFPGPATTPVPTAQP